jgi:hypothetical protein
MHPDDDFIEVVSILHSSPPSSSPSLSLCVSFRLTWGLGDCRGIYAWSSTSTHPFLRTQRRGHETRPTPRG